MYTSLYTCLYTCLQYTHVNMHACIHAYAHVYTHVYVHVCIHMSVRSVALMRAVHACSMYAHMRTRACMNTCRHTCMRARAPACTHAKACDVFHPYKDVRAQEWSGGVLNQGSSAFFFASCVNNKTLGPVTARALPGVGWRNDRASTYRAKSRNVVQQCWNQEEHAEGRIYHSAPSCMLQVRHEAPLSTMCDCTRSFWLCCQARGRVPRLGRRTRHWCRAILLPRRHPRGARAALPSLYVPAAVFLSPMCSLDYRNGLTLVPKDGSIAHCIVCALQTSPSLL